ILDRILILSNFQNEGVHLVQIVLSGQSELEKILFLPRFASLNQRTRSRFLLTGLDQTETGAYIKFRLHRFGQELEFTHNAIQAVWSASNGIPRVINHICSRVIDAAGGGYRQIRRSDVKNAIQDRSLIPLLPARVTVLSAKRTAAGLAAAWMLSLTLAVYLSPRFREPMPPLSERTAADEIQEPLSSPPPDREVPAQPASVAPSQKNPGPGSEKTPEQEFAQERTEGLSSGKDAPAENDVPQAVREQVRLDAIVWHTDPSRRWVVVNGKFLRQGEDDGPLHILAIDKTRVAFKQNGFTFSKRIEP
ncbi:MAG: hypothetical protein ACOC0U_04375, partial [Desulfovibrionales bacterium]